MEKGTRKAQPMDLTDHLSIHPLRTPTHRDRNAQSQIDNSFWNTTVQLGEDNNLPKAIEQLSWPHSTLKRQRK